MNISSLSKTESYVAQRQNKLVAHHEHTSRGAEPTDSYQASEPERETAGPSFLGNLAANFGSVDEDRAAAEQAKVANHRNHLEHLKHLNHLNHIKNASHHSGVAPAPVKPVHNSAAPTMPTAPPSTPVSHTAAPTKPATPPSTPVNHPAAPTRPSAPAQPVNGGSTSKGLQSIDGLKRGSTIFHTDFNGSRGSSPGSEFGTNQVAWNEKKLHQTNEKGDISSSNTELDGSGHLAMTATKDGDQYKQASYFTDKKVTFNLKDHPNGVVVETRAQFPTVDGVKFNPLWITTDHWTAQGAKGEKVGDTIEYDAAEGDAIQDSEEGGTNKKNGITIHNAYNAGTGGDTVDKINGYQHSIALEDGKYHTYTVKIQGDGSVTEFVDGSQVYSKAKAFPTDKDLSLKASLALENTNAVDSTRGTASADGLDSKTTGYIDYLDISNLA